MPRAKLRIVPLLAVKLGEDWPLAHMYVNGVYATGDEFAQAGVASGIHDRDIEDGVHCIAHRVEHERHATGVRTQQMQVG